MDTPSKSPSTPGRPVSDAQRVQALRVLNRRPWRLRWFSEWMFILFCAVVVVFFVARPFFVEAFKIPSGSMENTLLVGDFLFVNKAVYGAEVPFVHVRLPALQHPKRGEILVFEYPPNPEKDYVKRLVGLPGDTVEMRDGTVYIDGTALVEPYVVHTDPNSDPGEAEFAWQRPFLVRTAEASTHPSRNNWGPLVVPEGNYFVLGDNRDNSADSRYWGFVPDSLVRGRPMFVYYSYEPDATRRVPWLTNVRWSRIGTRVR
jgi:signal peptidase I